MFLKVGVALASAKYATDARAFGSTFWEAVTAWLPTFIFTTADLSQDTALSKGYAATKLVAPSGTEPQIFTLVPSTDITVNSSGASDALVNTATFSPTSQMTSLPFCNEDLVSASL